MSPDTLHNGIRLPAEWPPRTMDPAVREPMPVPYLDSPPPVVPIDVGRQLFVDSFLIERTDLKRVFHAARKYEGNPILVPETDAEQELGAATACPFDDGIVYDPVTKKFLLWYVASFHWDPLHYLGPGHTAVAVSDDGLHWERPDLDIVPGTNLVLPHESPRRSRDSFCPLLDHAAEDPSERFKAYLFMRLADPGRSRRQPNENWLLTSGDGVHWEHAGRFPARGADGTTLHYNPFRRKWVLNLKRGYAGMRGRTYIERDRFGEFLRLREATADEAARQVRRRDQPPPGLSEGEVLWVGADRLDLPDPDWVVQEPTQLYMLEVVPYESIMLGLFAIHYGPHNDVCTQGKFPKLTQIKLGYSRDGIPLASPGPGGVHRSHQAGWRLGPGLPETGVRLRHSSGTDSISTTRGSPASPPPECATSMPVAAPTSPRSAATVSSPWMPVRRPGSWSPGRSPSTGRHLFVNLDAPKGELRVEVLGPDGGAIEPFSIERCIPIRGDATRIRVRWRGAADLSTAGGTRGTPTRFRFRLTNGSLYAFWVTSDPGGKSHGYVASGGPGFDGPRDG